jgi:hypothetical protein
MPRAHTLRSEALAQSRALDHARELLCAVDLEHVRVRGSQYRGNSRVDFSIAAADVDKVHLQSKHAILVSKTGRGR